MRLPHRESLAANRCLSDQTLCFVERTGKPGNQRSSRSCRPRPGDSPLTQLRVRPLECPPLSQAAVRGCASLPLLNPRPPRRAGGKNNENRVGTRRDARSDVKNSHLYQSVMTKFQALKSNEISNHDQRVLHGPEGSENNGISQVEEASSGRAEQSDPHRPGAPL